MEQRPTGGYIPFLKAPIFDGFFFYFNDFSDSSLVPILIHLRASGICHSAHEVVRSRQGSFMCRRQSVTEGSLLCGVEFYHVVAAPFVAEDR